MRSRILIVEDDPISQDLIGALCKTRGFSVDVAADGFLGLRLLSELRHEIALVDYHLPEMDGYALARLMREVGANGSAPLRLIGMTADRDGLAARRGADSLFDTILTKPINPATLFATLERFSNPIDPPVARFEATAAVSHTPDAERALAAATALWRRCGLDGRPRVIIHPAPSPEEAAAIGFCFEEVDGPAEAELVLVLNADGLADLKSQRAQGEAFPVPSVDLSGGLSAHCDAMFRVNDVVSWSAVARTIRRFAAQRRRLSTDALPFDPADRLLTLMFVAERKLLLRRTIGNDAACDYVTGLSESELLAAITKLTRSEEVLCDFGDARIDVRISQAGRQRMTATGEAASAAIKPQADDCVRFAETSESHGIRIFRSHHKNTADDDLLYRGTTSDYSTSDLVEPILHDGYAIAPNAAPADPPGPVSLSRAGLPILNLSKLNDFTELVGHEQTLCLLAQLSGHLQTSFDRVEELADPLAREVHSLVSMTGMLGCDRLAQACSSLDEATGLDSAFANQLADVRRVRDDTLAAIAEFRAEAARDASNDVRFAMSSAYAFTSAM